MPRLVRRKPFFEKVKDFLNLGDILLWLSEEIVTKDWAPNHAVPLALGCHFIFLIAIANTGTSTIRGGDDVFGDDYSGAGWLNYIALLAVWILSGLSVSNAAYTFLRRRHYRLFERDIDTPQSTPSASRVRVDSPASSPLRLFSSILGDPSAESRAHPDPTRDVWEIAVWDPIPICLRLFCLFSPLHVFVYWCFLPTSLSDTHPSITLFKTLILEVLIWLQLSFLQGAFSQQERDSAIISQEVMSEYDIKFVHPRLNPIVRDVGTQFAGPTSEVEEEGDVDTYTPAVILKRGFRTNPNPNYAKHTDPDNIGGITRRGASPATVYTPSAYNSRDPTAFMSSTPKQPFRQPQFRQSTSTSISTSINPNDGGSLGIFNHVNSPLKKATLFDVQKTARDTPRNSYQMAAREIQDHKERSQSPAKRQSEAHRPFLGLEDNRRTSAPGSGFGLKQKSNQFNRMPSRF